LFRIHVCAFIRKKKIISINIPLWGRKKKREWPSPRET